MSLQSLAVDVLARNNNRAVLLDRNAAVTFVTNVQALATLSQEQEAARMEIRRQELASAYGYMAPDRGKPFVYSNGVGIIPVTGSLINRFAYSYSFLTGYAFIRGQLNAMLDDPDVEQIVLDVNSYGGEAAGCFEIANEIREARAVKPILAVVDSNCHSAAYAIGSAATKLVVTPSGAAGSIGVIMMHMDISDALKQSGVKVTLVAEGEEKTAGNPFEPLSESALADMRAQVSTRMDTFVNLVVANRGDKGLDAAAIRATQSRSYLADEALSLKLIDAVQTPTDAVSEFLAELGDEDPADEEDTTEMTTTPATGTMSAADHAAALATARTEAATAERARVNGILTHAEAADRPALANHLATSTDMSAEAAGALMAKAAKEPPPAAPAPATGETTTAGQDSAVERGFNAAMERELNPRVEPGAGTGTGGVGGTQQGPSRAAKAAASAGLIARH